LLLALPFANVHLTGLSSEQSTSISDTYSQFIAGSGYFSQQCRFKLECRAYRLEHAPTISAKELTADGQYAPRKLRRSDSIDLTGINFEAQLRLQSALASSYLGVAEEHEFAQANVIENFLRFLAAHRALDQGGVVLHSAGLVFEEQAFIFVGYSGAGKTTLTRKAHKGGAKVLSDDINILLPSQIGYRAHAVPFTGEFGRTLNHLGGHESFPVAGIVLLQQGDQLSTRSITKSAAMAKLLVGSPFVNNDEHESQALFDALSSVATQVPLIKLISRRDDKIEAIMKLVKDRIVHASSHS
jgi:hypothetical protein